MWLDASAIPLAAALETAYDEIRGEWQDLAEEDEWLPWVIPEAYQGTWLLFPLHAWNAAELGMEAAIARNRPRCPATVRLLERVPQLSSAAFSTIYPGTHIYAHVDAEHPRVIRCHLGIDVPADNLFRVAGETRPWRNGVCTAFDGQTEHEGANLGTAPRTIFMVDIGVDALHQALRPEPASDHADRR